MKSTLITAMIGCCAFLLEVSAKEVARKPENLTMSLAWIADAGQPAQHVFVINGVVA